MPNELLSRADVLCRALVYLPRYVSRWGMNKSAREVARSLHHHFDEALDLHGNGQEAHLFPALLAHVHGVDALPVLVATLKREHRALEKEWEGLRTSLTAVALCRSAKLSIDETTRFVTMYQHHVANEIMHLSALGSTALHLVESVGAVSRRTHRLTYRSQFGGSAGHADRRGRIDA